MVAYKKDINNLGNCSTEVQLSPRQLPNLQMFSRRCFW